MASRGTANADRRRGSTEKKKDAERERRARKAVAEGRTPGQRGRPPGGSSADLERSRQREEEPEPEQVSPEQNFENWYGASRERPGAQRPPRRGLPRGGRHGWSVDTAFAASAVLAERGGGDFASELALALQISAAEAGVPAAAAASNLDDLDDEALMAADFEEGQGHEADNSGTDVGEQEDEQLAQALPGSPRRRKPSSRRRCRSPRTWRSARRGSEPHAQRAQGRRLTMRRGERRPSARRRPRRQTLQQPSAPRLLCRQPRRSGGRSSSTLYLPTTT